MNYGWNFVLPQKHHCDKFDNPCALNHQHRLLCAHVALAVHEYVEALDLSIA